MAFPGSDDDLKEAKEYYRGETPLGEKFFPPT
jgi:hypothetical protein